MDSNFESQRLNAFLDGALDEPQQRATRAALRSDAALRAELHALRRVRDAVHAHAVLYPAPDRLAERIGLAVVLARGHAARGPQPAPRRVRSAWAAATIALVGLAAWGLVGVMTKVDADERLMDAAVTSHVRAARQARLVDLASTDREAVAAWLSTRLAFYAPPADDKGRAAAGLLGGRIDSLEGRSAATLVYKLDGHVVDVFVLPMASGDDVLATNALRGYTVSHWTHGGLRWCVVSDLPRRPLVAFVERLRQSVDAS